MKTLKSSWIVSWIFNEFTHSKYFTDYNKAMSFYYQLERENKNPSLHEGN